MSTCVCVCLQVQGPLRECLRAGRFRDFLLLHLHPCAFLLQLARQLYGDKTKPKKEKERKPEGLTPTFPLNNPPNPLPLKEPKDFINLSLKLDPEMKMQRATKHTCQKMNWAYQTVSSIVYSLQHDTPASLRGTRTSPLILYHTWQSCVFSHATQNLRYLLSTIYVQQIQSALISSLQRTLQCFTAAQITMLELGIPHCILRQAEQLSSLRFRYTITHTHLVSARLYTLRCQRRAFSTHP